jgi:hypothetical protein
MSRQLSAARSMGKRCSGRTSDKPKEGTKLRAIYDALIDGQVVASSDFGVRRGSFGASINQLRDYYGLEIEEKQRHSYRCLGEWDGPYFVPIERME